ncbi:MAG: PAS domain S-box protein [Limisphaerales bacterium]
MRQPPDPAHLPAKEALRRSEGGPITTVIADDDAGFRKLLSLFLARLEMPQVEILGVAGDGREVLELVAARRPRLLLMDIAMPGIDGVEAAGLVRERYPATRVIIISMNDSEEVKAACLAQGIDGFVSKSTFHLDLPRVINSVNDLACERLDCTREELLQRDLAEVDSPLAEPGVGEDIITQRKWARVAHAHLVTIIESADDAILANDLGGNIISWNSGAERLFGYSSEEVMGHSSRFLLPPERPEEEALIMARLQAGEPVVHLETIRLAKDGRHMEVLMTLSPLKNRGGQVIGASKIVRDITERKRGEGEMLKMTRVLEQCPVTVVITDLTGRIEYINPAFTKLTGYTREEVLGKNPRMLKSGKTAPEIYKRLWEAITSGHEWRGEFLNKARDGSLYWESSVISPIVNQAGQITHFLAVNEDITHKKHLEEQLRQAQKMEAIGQLAGGVAHDFNNILVATLMNLGMLQGNPHLSPETKESLREVERETLRAAALTRQLLTFSRRQAARIVPLEMNALVYNLLNMLRRLLGEHIEIMTQFSAEANWLSADEGMIEQVVMNLCINARDAMAGGGRLTIATAEVEIETNAATTHPDARSGCFACLSVSDTGCGMDETVLGKIFEPFFTTKEVGKGTGLGLATVYGIVKQHEGWVEVESAVGQGSSFRVYFPAAKPSAGQAISSPTEEIEGGSETILLVEDEAYVRRLVAQSLRTLGYSVLEASDGLEALKAWQAHHEKIALLFTDTLMPGKRTGLDLAVEFKKKKGSLKIVSSSGYSPVQAPCSLPAGEITYLPKPYTPAALAKVVRGCLDTP